MPPTPPWPARLVATSTLAPSVRGLVFEREDGPVAFEPGQWVNLELGTDAAPLKRAYSIASAPTGGSSFELAVTRIPGGPGSEALHAMQPGTIVRAHGPQGFFTRHADAGIPSLFVATGTGVTPLRSMIVAALARGAREPMTLLFGVRTEADILYRDELAALAAQHPSFRVVVTLSRPSADWTGATGYVQTHVAELWEALPEGRHVYVCGLDRMVKAVRDVARKQLGAAREQVHSERYD